MREIQGLLFDEQTGKAYLPVEGGEPIDTGFTFENPVWTGPFGLHLFWPNLNPWLFATRETAAAVLAMVQERFAHEAGLHIGLDETDKIVGPFTRTLERNIVISRGEASENFNVGLIATGIIRNGPQAAMAGLRAEMKIAGLVP